MNTYDFIPADTLFCRDARPLAAGVGFGHGANWPLPNTLHEALRAALLQAAGLGLPPGKTRVVIKIKNSVATKRHVGTSAFDWLHLHGPFPVDETGQVWFPTPRELLPCDDQGKTWAVQYRLVPTSDGGALTNMPLPLPFLPTAACQPGKEELPHWMCCDDFVKYLMGEPIKSWKAPELWETEHRIGIAIDAETHGTVEGQIYAAEHLRLRDDVRLRFAVSVPGGRQQNRPSFAEEGGKTVDDLRGVALALGGERRFGMLKEADAALTLPDVSARLSGVLIKWVLLTPAIFSGGWLPGWIQAQGPPFRVRLTILPDSSGYAQRTREERRAAMQAQAQPIAAELLAACVGKSQTITGWDLLESGQNAQGQPTLGGAKPTWLAVPSGSVFYFRADDEAAAKLLVQTLQSRCRSDFFGEKGLGLGVCGVFTLNA